MCKSDNCKNCTYAFWLKYMDAPCVYQVTRDNHKVCNSTEAMADALSIRVYRNSLEIDILAMDMGIGLERKR